MKRTKLRNRTLPAYTKGEELANMITHIVGGAIGILVLTYALVFSISKGDAWRIVSGSLYGVSFISLYTISSVYHGLRPNLSKKILQILDHCAIYLFIAATYTPVLFCAMRPSYPGYAWILTALVWGLAATAITLTAIDLKKYDKLSMICYIGMGWLILIAIKPLMDTLPLTGFILLLLGGILYSVGAVLYHIGKKFRYIHSVFHVFVLAGSILHALCILLYVL